MNFYRRLRKGNLQKKSAIEQTSEHLSSSLEQNLKKIKQILGNSPDVIVREFDVGADPTVRAAVVYIKGLTDQKAIQDFILETMMIQLKEIKIEEQFSEAESFTQFKNIITVGEIRQITEMRELFQLLLSGDAILLLDQTTKCFAIGMQGWEQRNVDEPPTQTVLRGPREGFTENLLTNVSLIRRRIKDTRLRFEVKQIGKMTKTSVAIMYMKGVTDEVILNDLQKRLDSIDIASVFEGGTIEQAIEDGKYTPFPTVYNTERPDVVAAGLVEGRIAIFVDGTPFVLLVPTIFSQFYQTPEDYYQRADFGTMIRILRYIGLLIALTGPAFYIAVTTFHQEMIPHPLLINLASQREGVPFPTFVESTFLLLMFEILREAGVRMPRVVGQAVSIVGAIVIGQAAVEAGIVSAAVVIVISATAISSFVLPANNMEIAVRILRLGLMCLAAALGLFGLIMGLIAVTLHLSSLHSFGVPYMSPFAPFVLSAQKDSLLRLPFHSKRKESQS